MPVGMIGVAISGKAGSGKSTLAKHLLAACDRYDQPAEKIAFADELKREVFELHGITKEMVGGRDMLIRYGEEKRVADPDYWIRPVAKRVHYALVCGVLPIVDDMRFLRELEWARSECLTTVRMVAPPAWRQQRLHALGLDGDFAFTNEVGEHQLDGEWHDERILNGPRTELALIASVLLSRPDQLIRSELLSDAS